MSHTTRRHARGLLAACVLGLGLLASGCAGVPFGGHAPLADGGLEAALRADLPTTASAAQARLRGTLRLGDEALELTFLVRVDGPGQGRVAAVDDLGLRLFDVELRAGEPRMLSSAPGMPARPLLDLAADLVAALGWAPAAGWTAVRTDDGRAALADSLSGHERRLSRRPPADLAPAPAGADETAGDDALWLEIGVQGTRRACIRLEAWTSGPWVGLVYPARLRVVVPGEGPRLVARLESWRPLTDDPPSESAAEP